MAGILQQREPVIAGPELKIKKGGIVKIHNHKLKATRDRLLLERVISDLILALEVLSF